MAEEVNEAAERERAPQGETERLPLPHNADEGDGEGRLSPSASVVEYGADEPIEDAERADHRESFDVVEGTGAAASGQKVAESSTVARSEEVFFSTEEKLTEYSGQYPALRGGRRDGVVMEESHVVEEEEERRVGGYALSRNGGAASTAVELGPKAPLHLNEQSTFYDAVGEEPSRPPTTEEREDREEETDNGKKWDTLERLSRSSSLSVEEVKELALGEFRLHEGSGTVFINFQPDERDPSRDRSVFALAGGLQLGHHPDAVTSCEWTPSNAVVLTSCMDGALRAWNPVTGELEHLVKGHAAAATSVRVALDGHTIASASLDHTVRLWNLDNWDAFGERKAELSDEQVLVGHSRGVYSVAFSPSGGLLASGSSDRTVRLWSTSNGRLMHTVYQHRGPVHAVAFTPQGDRVLSASDDTTVGVWDVETGKEVSRLRGHYKFVSYVDAFPSPSQSLCASASADGTLRIWDLRQPTAVNTVGANDLLPSEERAKRELSLSAKHVVDEKEPNDKSLPLRRATCLRFRPDGEGLLSAGEDGRLLSYELRKGGAQLTALATFQVEVPIDGDGVSVRRKPLSLPLGLQHCAFANIRSSRMTRLPIAVATGKYDNALRIVEMRKDILS